MLTGHQFDAFRTPCRPRGAALKRASHLNYPSRQSDYPVLAKVAETMARHASLPNPTARRALVVLATAGVALGSGVVTAAADSGPVAGEMRTRPTRWATSSR